MVLSLPWREGIVAARAAVGAEGLHGPLLDLLQGEVVRTEACWVDGNLVLFDTASPRDNIYYTGDLAQLRFENPILEGLQLYQRHGF